RGRKLTAVPQLFLTLPALSRPHRHASILLPNISGNNCLGDFRHGLLAHRVDIRVVAATNQDLETMVERRHFRADLFYRLSVFPILLPPLRARKEDIRDLATHFVRKFSEQQNKVIEAIPEDVMVALEEHDWPGNIRELQNVIERGVILTTCGILSRLTTAPLMTRARAGAPARSAVEFPVKTLADAERAHIVATLRRTNGVIGGPRGAAAQLGLPRTTLIAKMARLGIATGLPRRRFSKAEQESLVVGRGSVAVAG
ncbi:MAG: sigma 54-interacting transcriptional regulator, partial [Bryobacteraceae bacterium]|nr:sigma 54-interacting transcriptional regulator [Bryobacteraceae bacterium]